MNVQLKMVGPAAILAATLFASACGGSSSPNNAQAGSGSGSGSGSSSMTKSETTPIGTVLADSSGKTIYELAGATEMHNMCTGSCLSIWPAVMDNGKQLVVNGHPAFTFASDSGPGSIGGEGLTDAWGTWWALSPSGNPITKTKPAPSGGSSSGGSGGGWA